MEAPGGKEMLIFVAAWRKNEVIGCRLRADQGSPNMPAEPILRSTLLRYSVVLSSLDQIRIIHSSTLHGNLLGDTRFGKQIVDGESDKSCFCSSAEPRVRQSFLQSAGFTGQSRNENLVPESFSRILKVGTGIPP
jgi:hypothetical protein